MHARHSTLPPSGYFLSFLFSMFALNVLAAAASGLIPDIVRRDQIGQANGIMAMLMAGGACCGFLFSFFNKDQNHLYAVYIVLALARCAAAAAPAAGPATAVAPDLPCLT